MVFEGVVVVNCKGKRVCSWQKNDEVLTIVEREVKSAVRELIKIIRCIPIVNY